MRRLSVIPRDIFEDFDKSLGEIFAPSFKKTDPVQVVEEDNNYLINVDLPGVKKDSVNIELKEDLLVIEANRKNEFETEGYYERNYGKFKRSFKLPKNIIGDELAASMEDGVLKIILPKSSKSSNIRKIEIQDAHPKISKAS